jgi:hypothetical protein
MHTRAMPCRWRNWAAERWVCHAVLDVSGTPLSLTCTFPSCWHLPACCQPSTDRRCFPPVPAVLACHACARLALSDNEDVPQVLGLLVDRLREEQEVHWLDAIVQVCVCGRGGGGGRSG